MIVPSGSLRTGSFVSPVALRSSSREPLRRNGIGWPWAAITFSYSIPAARSASCTRRHGCLRGPPSSPWHTYSVGVSASMVVLLQLAGSPLTGGRRPGRTGSRRRLLHLKTVAQARTHRRLAFWSRHRGRDAGTPAGGSTRQRVYVWSAACRGAARLYEGGRVVKCGSGREPRIDCVSDRRVVGCHPRAAPWGRAPVGA